MLKVKTEDVIFGRYAEANGLVVSPTIEDDTLVRPLLDTMATQLAAYPINAESTLGSREIHMGFLDAPSPNAFADLWAQKAMICVHSGMLRSILEAAIQIQDRVGAFEPGFETSSKTPGLADIEGPIGVTGYLNWLQNKESEEESPDTPHDEHDPATLRATAFISSGIQFVVLHEFGHIANGHLHWLEDSHEPTRLFEVTESLKSCPPKETAVRWFFEHEADVFALEILIRSALMRQLSGAKLAIAPADEVLVIMLSFLTTVFGWISLEQSLGRSPKAAHPTAFNRLFTLPMALMGLLNQQPEFEAPLTTALERCRAILARSVARYPRFQPLMEVFSPRQLAQLDTLIDWMRKMDSETEERMKWRL